jgi:threonyl-tRNA synthetase
MTSLQRQTHAERYQRKMMPTRRKKQDMIYLSMNRDGDMVTLESRELKMQGLDDLIVSS